MPKNDTGENGIGRGPTSFYCAICWKKFPESELVVVDETFAGRGFRCVPCKKDRDLREGLGL